MPSLREIQRSIAADLRSGAAEALGRDVVAGTFPGERLLQVYRNNIYLSFTDALACSYPVVARLVGDGFFAYLAHEFINRHPSTEGSLQRFGSELPEFMASFEPARTLPDLPDVARLEWAWDEVFHGPDHPPFSPHSLAGVPSERFGELRFSLHPAVRLMESEYPIASIWEVNQEGWDGDQAVNLRGGGEHVLLARHGIEVTVHRLDPGPYRLLQGLATGLTLERALADTHDEHLDLNVWLQRWVASDVIVKATL